jgi:hypothetical protein
LVRLTTPEQLHAQQLKAPGPASMGAGTNNGLLHAGSPVGE